MQHQGHYIIYLPGLIKRTCRQATECLSGSDTRPRLNGYFSFRPIPLASIARSVDTEAGKDKVAFGTFVMHITTIPFF